MAENIATVACTFVLRAPTLLFGCAKSKHVFPKVLEIFLNIVAEEEVGAILCCDEVLLPVLIKVLCVPQDQIDCATDTEKDFVPPVEQV